MTGRHPADKWQRQSTRCCQGAIERYVPVHHGGGQTAEATLDDPALDPILESAQGSRNISQRLSGGELHDEPAYAGYHCADRSNDCHQESREIQGLKTFQLLAIYAEMVMVPKMIAERDIKAYKNLLGQRQRGGFNRRDIQRQRILIGMKLLWTILGAFQYYIPLLALKRTEYETQDNQQLRGYIGPN